MYTHLCYVFECESVCKSF